jgi:hypothetical protein
MPADVTSVESGSLAAQPAFAAVGGWCDWEPPRLKRRRWAGTEPSWIRMNGQAANGRSKYDEWETPEAQTR